ncbi:DUF3905 domain-containing protein [Bacillus tianshenii]|nr:DUF3905 domain-containing protein [Bacillus tianshenii]
MKNNHQKELEQPQIDGVMPHQINSPDFKNSHIKPEKPFINSYGVVIGDSRYDSEASPLNQWSIETDPNVMAGDEWVHPTNDIGWNTEENRELAENKRIVPKARFMHSTKDTSYFND